MKDAAYLGLDLGGTGAKAGLFNAEGSLLGLGQARFEPQISPAGHAEIAIDEIYLAARQAVRQALAGSGARVLALAISSQGQTFVALDEDDRPLHPAIMWYDSRAAEQAAQLQAAAAHFSGAVPEPSAIATASKILWLRAQRPELMRRARRYLLLPDYFAYRLSGEAVTDPNTAATTALYTADGFGYHAGLLEAVGLELAQLARVLPCGSPVAPVRPELAAEWGLAPETLLVTGTNDQYAGALGAGNCRPGILSETSGTCLAMVTLTEQRLEPVPCGLFTGRFPIAAYYYLLAYSKTAGVVLDWFRKNFAPTASLEDLTQAAAGVPIGAHGVSMLPTFDGAISPRPNQALRGVFANLSLQHTSADLFRAILEALSFALHENILHLSANGFAPEVIRSIGGGARNDFWLQMKADLTGLTVEKPAVTEAAVLGAAMLAASGQGAYRSLAEASAALYRPSRLFNPDPERHGAYQEAYQRYQKLRCRWPD